MAEKLSPEEQRIRDLNREHGTAPIEEGAHPTHYKKAKPVTKVFSGGRKEEDKED